MKSKTNGLNQRFLSSVKLMNRFVNGFSAPSLCVNSKIPSVSELNIFNAEYNNVGIADDQHIT